MKQSHHYIVLGNIWMVAACCCPENQPRLLYFLFAATLLGIGAIFHVNGN